MQEWTINRPFSQVTALMIEKIGRKEVNIDKQDIFVDFCSNIGVHM